MNQTANKITDKSKTDKCIIQNVVVSWFLREAINKVIEENPEYSTKEGAKGKCIIASDKLMFTCDEIKGSLVNAKLEGDLNLRHHWANIDGVCVDLTARQFDESEPFPKIWKA